MNTTAYLFFPLISRKPAAVSLLTTIAAFYLPVPRIFISFKSVTFKTISSFAKASQIWEVRNGITPPCTVVTLNVNHCQSQYLSDTHALTLSQATWTAANKLWLDALINLWFSRGCHGSSSESRCKLVPLYNELALCSQTQIFRLVIISTIYTRTWNKTVICTQIPNKRENLKCGKTFKQLAEFSFLSEWLLNKKARIKVILWLRAKWQHNLWLEVQQHLRDSSLVERSQAMVDAVSFICGGFLNMMPKATKYCHCKAKLK